MSDASQFDEKDPFDQRVMPPLHEFNLTTQQAYEKVRAHFTAPGAMLGRSDVPGKSCAYRTERNGQTVKCAVGCLIPDEHYDPIMDTGKFVMIEHEPEGWEDYADAGWTATQIDTTFDDLHAAGVLGVAENIGLADLLSNVQSAHDSADSVEEFIDQLDSIARHAGLTTV